MGVTSTATLQGHRAIRARASIPKWGAWYADATLDTEQTLKGSVELALADLTLRGTVIAGGPANGRSHYRIVGGKGRWGRKLKATSEADDGGVKVSTILQKAAQECGEALDATTLPKTRVGPHWTRPAGPARELLELLAPSAWYIGEDGVTRLGARPLTTYAGKASLEPVDLSTDTLVLAPETLVGLLPGASVGGLVAVDVEHELADGKLRTTVWGTRSRSAASSRRLDAFRGIFEALDPGRRFRGLCEYRVALLSGDRLDLQPVRVSSGLPELRRVPVWPGVAGAKATLRLGARVVVAFLDASPARPIVVAHEDASGAGFQPDSISLGDATSYVALATQVTSALNTLKTAFGTWTPVALDGGAALKTVLSTALSSWPPSVASSKVKA